MTEAPSNNESGRDRRGSYVHADAVLIAETGVLIRGESGVGKSRLVLTLTFVAEAVGYFARLVGDDRIYLEPSGDRLIARAHPSVQGAIEWRGQGIFQTRFVDAVVVGLVVDLVFSDKVALPRCPDGDQLELLLAGVRVPSMTLRSDLGPSDQALYILQYFRLHRKKDRGAPPAAGTIP